MKRFFDLRLTPAIPTCAASTLTTHLAVSTACLEVATLGILVPQTNHLRRIRICLAIVIAGLAVSGITAFPLESELRWMLSIFHSSPIEHIAQSTHLLPWLERVHEALASTNVRYPFLAYGTDWLAFAHLVLAVLFVGAYVDPVRNKWVVTFGLIACLGVLPLALIAGPIRGIPFGWRLIDCSFGVFGSVPLLVCLLSIQALERESS
jgi:hypothetical protein